MAFASDDRISFFPQEEDLRLMDRAALLRRQVSRLSHWVGQFAEARQHDPGAKIREDDQLTLLRLLSQGRSLFTSSQVPVACAIYGPSQVGKSLLMGRVLKDQDPTEPTLGRDEGYSDRPISFEGDLNPSCGDNEATALVTRFTTSERMNDMNPDPQPEFPVLVRALNRAQWLSVLGRGFQTECRRKNFAWNKDSLLASLTNLRKEKAWVAETCDLQWRDDLLQVYSYLRENDERTFALSETDFNSLLGCRPLSPDGYIELAAAMFWDGWPELTTLFREVASFLEDLRRQQPRTGDGPRYWAEDTIILTGWSSVRFLLDSARLVNPLPPPGHSGPAPSWNDFVLARSSPAEWFTLRQRNDLGTGPQMQVITKDLGTVQAAMLEMVVPVLPDRMTECWRRVLKKMDLLDVPGMHAGRGGPEQGKSASAATEDERFNIVKRGKVAFLFERYTDERLIQTLVLLARGGLMEVGAYMNWHVNKWGRSRYDERWPDRVNDDPPSLLLGLTGIDEEFREHTAPPQPALYMQRLKQLAGALGPVMENFGGRKFRNVYVLRYPGTLDSDETRRKQVGEHKWKQAREAFLACQEVQDYVLSPDVKWDAAMREDDGGVSLVSDCIFRATSGAGKRKQLQEGIEKALLAAQKLTEDWYVNAEPIKERQRRAEHACRVLRWLHEDRDQIYYRVQALTEALTLREAEIQAVADLADMHSAEHAPGIHSLDNRLRDVLRSLLKYWATKLAPSRWAKFMESQRQQGADLFERHYAPRVFGETDFSLLTKYLSEYLCTEEEHEKLVRKLYRIVAMNTRDDTARTVSRRRCTRLLLNDFVLNPGSSIGRLKPVEGVVLPTDWGEGLGLMKIFVARWRDRLPGALAAGASSLERAPSGNDELGKIRSDFQD